MLRKNIRSTKAQISYLCRYMDEHPDFAAGDFRSPQGALRMQQEWERLTAALDELGAHRSVEQWKTMPMTPAEKQRKYREKLKTNHPEKYEEMRKKYSENALKYYRNKINNSTPEQKEEQRRKWKEYREKSKAQLPSTSQENSKVEEACWRDQKRKARMESGAVNRALDSQNITALSDSSAVLGAQGLEQAVGSGPSESPIGVQNADVTRGEDAESQVRTARSLRRGDNQSDLSLKAQQVINYIVKSEAIIEEVDLDNMDNMDMISNPGSNSSEGSDRLQVSDDKETHQANGTENYKTNEDELIKTIKKQTEATARLAASMERIATVLESASSTFIAMASAIIQPQNR